MLLQGARRGHKKRDMAGSTQEVTPESTVCDGKHVTDHGIEEGQKSAIHKHGISYPVKTAGINDLDRARKGVGSGVEA